MSEIIKKVDRMILNEQRGMPTQVIIRLPAAEYQEVFDACVKIGWPPYGCPLTAPGALEENFLFRGAIITIDPLPEPEFMHKLAVGE